MSPKLQQMRASLFEQGSIQAGEMIFLVNMDGPQPTESKKACKEGFLIRTRVNTGMNGTYKSVIIDTDKVMEATDQRYADNLDTGSQVISFDQQYDYVWTNMKNDARCEILDEKLFGKVCKWSEKPVPY